MRLKIPPPRVGLQHPLLDGRKKPRGSGLSGRFRRPWWTAFAPTSCAVQRGNSEGSDTFCRPCPFSTAAPARGCRFQRTASRVSRQSSPGPSVGRTARSWAFAAAAARPGPQRPFPVPKEAGRPVVQTTAGSRPLPPAGRLRSPLPTGPASGRRLSPPPAGCQG